MALSTRTALLALGLGALALPAAAADDTVKIGVVAAESGAFVSAGHTLPAGVSLAVKEINDAGGVKVGDKTYKIELVRRDDRTDIGTAVAATQELVRDVGVKAIFGSESHDFTLAMAKITQPAKILHFAGNSTLDTILTDAAVAPGGENHYLFQSEPREFQRSGSTARGVLSLLQPLVDHPIKKSVIIAGNDATGQFLSSYYIKALKAEGQEVPDIIFYPPDTTDFSPILTRAKSLNPDVVHFWYNGDSTLTALPQALELAVAPSYFLFGVDPGIWKERGLSADVPVAMSCVPVCWGESSNAKAKSYFDAYFAAGAPKGVTSSVSLLYYDYVHMLAEAWTKAGSFDPDKVVDALLVLHHQGVVSDDLSFNAHHQVTHATEVCVADPAGKLSCAMQQPPADAPM
ncbi:ABC-type branched-subunit amino acid transport system substrate-binding protein [Inquilinus ginsengisoli]|uniref:ABC-type branched-subunit amino acid transport system substrate-binding protein n=1 Tax=Inquilinus ginsengisoli TaxID=363840 RepID=A0ABU1JSH4_9PROT|nr:ABC transporter substrate-binding protein [Inquilinus ginsengisoli]MDR6291576.1 ABC-type branched-subunit amino acid transport system substrate-binding protein [Inquilinus ginsengisoli]